MAFPVPDRLSGQTIRPTVSRSLFQSDPIGLDPVAFRDAAITHVEFQLGESPVRTGAKNEADVCDDLDAFLEPRLTWCRAHGFRAVGLLDALCRQPHTLANVTAGGLGRFCLEETARRARDSGLVDSVEAVDEANQVLREGPAHHGIAQVVQWWRLQDGPPLTWPGQQPANWETPELSDYCSRYWSWWHFRTLAEYARAIHDQCKTVRRDRPFVGLVKATGEFCETSGVLINPATKPAHVKAQAWLWLAHGASGLRAYKYGRDQREDGTVPGDARWERGIVPAFQSIRDRDWSLRGPHYRPIVRSDSVTGRRGLLAWRVDLKTGAVRFRNLERL